MLLEDQKPDGGTFDELLSLEEHSGEVNAVDFSPNGRYVLSAGADGQAIHWPGIQIEPSLSVPDNEIEYTLGESNELLVARNAQLIDPTLASFSSAMLTVEIADDVLNPLVEQDRKFGEHLSVTLRPGFELVENLPHKLVITQSQVANSSKAANMKSRMDWEAVIKSISYAHRTATDDDVLAQGESAQEQNVVVRLENIKYMTWGVQEPNATDKSLDASETIKIRLQTPQLGDPAGGDVAHQQRLTAGSDT